jgi:hypothetical protein
MCGAAIHGVFKIPDSLNDLYTHSTWTEILRWWASVSMKWHTFWTRNSVWNWTFMRRSRARRWTCSSWTRSPLRITDALPLFSVAQADQVRPGPLARRDPSLNCEDMAVPLWVAVKISNSVPSTRSGPKCPFCAHSIAKTTPTAPGVLPWHSLRLWTRDSLDTRRISSLFYQQIWSQLAALQKISIDTFIVITPVVS